MTAELYTLIVKSALTNMLRDFNCGKSLMLSDGTQFSIADDADKWRDCISYCIEHVQPSRDELERKIDDFLDENIVAVKSMQNFVGEKRLVNGKIYELLSVTKYTIINRTDVLDILQAHVKSENHYAAFELDQWITFEEC